MAKEKAAIDVKLLAGIKSVMDFWAHRVPIMTAVRVKNPQFADDLERLSPYDFFLHQGEIIAAIEGD